jgi:hypothetical protein
MADPKVTAIVTADTTGFQVGMQRVRESMSEAQKRIGEVGKTFASTAATITADIGKISFEGLLASIARTQVAFAGIAVGALGIKSLTSALDDLDEAAQAVGLSAVALSEMRAAAVAAGLGSDKLEASLTRLNVKIAEAAAGNREAAAVFRAMDVAIRNADGSLRSTEEVLADIADRFRSYADGATKAALAVDLFGKTGAAMVPYLNQGGEALRTLGNLTEETVRQAAQLQVEFDSMGIAARQLGNTIAAEVIPPINEFIQSLRDTRIAGAGFLPSFNAALIRSSEGVEGVRQHIARLNEEIAKLNALRTDPAGDRTVLSYLGVLEFKIEQYQSVVGALQAILDQEKGRADAAERSAEDKRHGVAEKKRQAPVVSKDEAGPKRAPDDPSFMAYYEAALSEERRLALEKDALREYTKQQEAEFWRNLLANAELTGRDRVAITRKAADLEVQIMREAAQTRRGLDAEAVAERERSALAQITAARQEVRAMRDDDLITKTQQLELEQQFAQQELEIQRAAVQARMEALQNDPTKNAVALAQLNDKLLELERQYQLKRRETEIQQQRESQFSWKGLFDSIGQSFSQAILGMLKGTATFAQAIRGIFGSLLDAIVGFLAQWAAKWAATQLANLVIGKATAASEIGTASAKAGAEGTASWAGAPWPINMGAPAFGASMAATAASFGALLSAAGGFDIPAGVNPITQLHQREMVLPASIADPLREQLAGAGGLGPNVTVNYTDSSGKLSQAEIRDKIRVIMREAERAHRQFFKPS